MEDLQEASRLGEVTCNCLFLRFYFCHHHHPFFLCDLFLSEWVHVFKRYYSTQLFSGVNGLMGKSKSVKCIFSKDGKYDLTRDALVYFTHRSSRKNHVHYVIQERCKDFTNRFSFGSAEYLYFVGVWCRCYTSLLKEGVPMSVISHVCSDLMKQAGRRSVSQFSVSIGSVEDVESFTKTAKKARKPAFNIYSRHHVAEFSMATRNERMVNRETSLKKLCWQLCCTCDDELADLISEAFISISNHSPVIAQNTLHVGDVIIESCVNSYARPRCLDGLLIPCYDWFVVDAINTCRYKNVILVNRIAYGVQLATDKFTQVITLNDFVSSQVENENLFDTLTNLGVNCIILRGDMEANMSCKLNERGIMVLRLNSYRKLHQVSKLLNVDMLYELKNVATSDVAEVQLSMLSLSEYVRPQGRKDDSFIWLHSRKDGKRYRTLLLTSPTEDLLGLLVESAMECVNRVHDGLSAQHLITCGDGQVERRLLDSLVLCQLTSCGVSWVDEDSKLFKNLICERVTDYFKTHLRLLEERNELWVECCDYRVALWESTLKCAKLIATNKKININF